MVTFRSEKKKKKKKQISNGSHSRCAVKHVSDCFTGHKYIHYFTYFK